jgi:phosphatidylglycerol:prolipoprotein diacylglycerol transferase
MSSMPIVQHPFDFAVGPLHLTGFGLAMMAAFGMAHWVSQEVLEQRGDDPMVVFWGGFIGAVTLCAIVIRWKRLNFLRIADGAAVGIAAGYAIGRTGCWAVGDDYGRVWNNGWLAVSFPQGLPPTTVQVMNEIYHANLPATLAPGDVVGVYPTQLLEVVLGLAMFGILWRLRRHTHAAGWLFGVYCVLAGIERFIVEFFRAKSDMVGPVTSAQVVALAVAAAGVLLMTWRRAPMPTVVPAR